MGESCENFRVFTCDLVFRAFSFAGVRLQQRRRQEHVLFFCFVREGLARNDHILADTFSEIKELQVNGLTVWHAARKQFVRVKPTVMAMLQDSKAANASCG